MKIQLSIIIWQLPQTETLSSQILLFGDDFGGGETIEADREDMEQLKELEAEIKQRTK